MVTSFDVFGYDFPHWKTSIGLLHLCSAGLKPAHAWLAPRKVLNIPTSKYRLAPAVEAWPEPHDVCEALDIDYTIIDHDEYRYIKPVGKVGLILGARILKRPVIWSYPRGIVNIHPGILPGNRGLDNVKWAIIKRLPIGATAHFIDHRVDMGRIICRSTLDIKKDMELREIVPALRAIEMRVMLAAMGMVTDGLQWDHCEPVAETEKFSAVPDFVDQFLPELWLKYKKDIL